MEDFVASYFKRRGWTVKRAVGNTPAYDICITRETSSVFIEIKHDILSEKTGNYCLELASLEHTQSSVLIIGTPNLAWVLPMDTARKLFNDYPKKQTGDFPNNYSALVPKQIFVSSNFQRL